MQINNCNDIIPECKKNEISVSGYCIPLSNIQKNPEYTFTQTYDKSGYNNYKTIQITQNSSLFDGIESCVNNDNCDAIRYDYGNNKEGYEFSDTSGNVTLLQNDSGATRNSMSPYTDDNSCASLYIKQKNTDNIEAGAVSMVSNDKTKKVSLNLSKKYKAGVSTQRIKNPYEGVECRKYVSQGGGDPKNTDLMNNMISYCNDNKDLQVCNDFCAQNIYSDYCSKNSPILLIVFASVFLLLVFIIMYIFSQHNKYSTEIVYMILVVLIIFTIIGFILSYIKYSKKIFSGNTADNSTSDLFPDINTKCTSKDTPGTCYKGCRSIFGACDCIKSYRCNIIQDITKGSIEVVKNSGGIKPGGTATCIESNDCYYQETSIGHECVDCDILNDIGMTCNIPDKKSCLNLDDSNILSKCIIPPDNDVWVPSGDTSSNCSDDDGCKYSDNDAFCGSSHSYKDLIQYCANTGYLNTCLVDDSNQVYGDKFPVNATEAITHGVKCSNYYLRCYKYPESVRQTTKCGDVPGPPTVDI